MSVYGQLEHGAQKICCMFRLFAFIFTLLGIARGNVKFCFLRLFFIIDVGFIYVVNYF